jgi:acetate kinase
MIYDYLHREKNWSLEQISQILNKDSGLKGLCGSNDMRTVAELASQGNENAKLARQMYAYRIKKYIGAYYAVLGRVDAIVFSGGIGEHDAQLRAECCKNLENLGIKIDRQQNLSPAEHNGQIQHLESKTAVLVIATQEELAIALHAWHRCIEKNKEAVI